jgi:hypothetical protein
LLSKREAVSCEVWAVSVSPGAAAPHRTPTWTGRTRGARRAAGSRRVFVARKRPGASGSQRSGAQGWRTCRDGEAVRDGGGRPGPERRGRS